MTVSQCDEQTKDVEIRGRVLHKKDLLNHFPAAAGHEGA